ncbi:unnamed protein product [Thlaspi arvense]|uniref:Bacterial surface antigen (D15) domain-containing protein n=1 Tax=Thlaspi arvense TaxID=13288 RepID=A0AAU9SYP0_THLAR|nr:unnamed protein product [Thlaspi arvense]
MDWLGPLEGAVFADYGTDLGSALLCNDLLLTSGDPAGARLKPGSGYGYGFGIRVDSPLGPLRLEYAFNDHKAGGFTLGLAFGTRQVLFTSTCSR